MWSIIVLIYFIHIKQIIKPHKFPQQCNNNYVLEFNKIANIKNKFQKKFVRIFDYFSTSRGRIPPMSRNRLVWNKISLFRKRLEESVREKAHFLKMERKKLLMKMMRTKKKAKFSFRELFWKSIQNSSGLNARRAFFIIEKWKVRLLL